LRIEQFGQGFEIAAADHPVPALEGRGDVGLQGEVGHGHSGFLLLSVGMTVDQPRRKWILKSQPEYRFMPEADQMRI
jgi:hypothetical protein